MNISLPKFIKLLFDSSTRRQSELFKLGPNIIGATGGSGSRVVARIVRDGGMFIGTNLNGSEDALDFKEYCDRWINTFMARRTSQTEMIQEFQAVLEKHLTGLELGKTAQRWGWKAPRSIFLLPFFHSQFPRMKFLHVVRDGRDMAYSENQNQLVLHGSTLLEESESEWSQPVRAIALWSRLNLLAASYGENNLGENYLLIRFEDLCAEPVATINRIFDFFGLKGDVCKIAELEVSPPESIGRWRSQDRETLAELHRVGREALQKFGYWTPE